MVYTIVRKNWYIDETNSRVTNDKDSNEGICISASDSCNESESDDLWYQYMFYDLWNVVDIVVYL